MLTEADYPRIKRLVWWFAKRQRRPADYELDDLVQDVLCKLHQTDFVMDQLGWRAYIGKVVWRLVADASRRADRRSVLKRKVFLTDGEDNELLIDSIPDPIVEELDDDRDYDLLIQVAALGWRRTERVRQIGCEKLGWLVRRARKNYAARIA